MLLKLTFYCYKQFPMKSRTEESKFHSLSHQKISCIFQCALKLYYDTFLFEWQQKFLNILHIFNHRAFFLQAVVPVDHFIFPSGNCPYRSLVRRALVGRLVVRIPFSVMLRPLSVCLDLSSNQISNGTCKSDSSLVMLDKMSVSVSTWLLLKPKIEHCFDCCKLFAEKYSNKRSLV